VSEQIIPGLPRLRKCWHKLFRGFRNSESVSTKYSEISETSKKSAQIVLWLPKHRKCQHKLFLGFRSSKNASTKYSEAFETPEM